MIISDDVPSHIKHKKMDKISKSNHSDRCSYLFLRRHHYVSNTKKHGSAPIRPPTKPNNISVNSVCNWGDQQLFIYLSFFPENKNDPWKFYYFVLVTYDFFIQQHPADTETFAKNNLRQCLEWLLCTCVFTQSHKEDSPFLWDTTSHSVNWTKQSVSKLISLFWIAIPSSLPCKPFVCIFSNTTNSSGNYLVDFSQNYKVNSISKYYTVTQLPVIDRKSVV